MIKCFIIVTPRVFRSVFHAQVGRYPQFIHSCEPAIVVELLLDQGFVRSGSCSCSVLIIISSLSKLLPLNTTDARMYEQGGHLPYRGKVEKCYHVKETPSPKSVWTAATLFFSDERRWMIVQYRQLHFCRLQKNKCVLLYSYFQGEHGDDGLVPQIRNGANGSAQILPYTE